MPVSVYLPAWVTDSDEEIVAVGDRWQPPIVANATGPLVPARSPRGSDRLEALPVVTAGPAALDASKPRYGWTASGVGTVPPGERVAPGRPVGHLELTAMDAGGFRFAVEGSYEGRWTCAGCWFEYASQLLDDTSPIRELTRMDLLVVGIQRVVRRPDGGVDRVSVQRTRPLWDLDPAQDIVGYHVVEVDPTATRG